MNDFGEKALFTDIDTLRKERDYILKECALAELMNKHGKNNEAIKITREIVREIDKLRPITGVTKLEFKFKPFLWQDNDTLVIRISEIGYDEVDKEFIIPLRSGLFDEFGNFNNSDTLKNTIHLSYSEINSPEWIFDIYKKVKKKVWDIHELETPNVISEIEETFVKGMECCRLNNISKYISKFADVCGFKDKYSHEINNYEITNLFYPLTRLGKMRELILRVSELEVKDDNALLFLNICTLFPQKVRDNGRNAYNKFLEKLDKKDDRRIANILRMKNLILGKLNEIYNNEYRWLEEAWKWNSETHFIY